MRQAAFPRTLIALAPALLAVTSPRAATPADVPSVHFAAPAGRAAAAAAAASPVASTTPATAAASTAAQALPLADACPAQLPVRQTVVEDIAGWTSLNQQGSYPFARVSFHAGPPTDALLIVPSVEYRGAAGLHDAWDLPRRASGYWVNCAYGNTTATVARKLDDAIDYCQADYDGRFMTLVVKRWSCGIKRSMVPAYRFGVHPRPPAKPAPRPPQK